MLVKLLYFQKKSRESFGVSTIGQLTLHDHEDGTRFCVSVVVAVTLNQLNTYHTQDCGCLT